MELHEARKNLVFVLSCVSKNLITHFREKRVRCNARILRIKKALEELEKYGKIQNGIRELKKIESGLSEKEMDKLRMFFSPLRIPTWLNFDQATLCLDLYDMMPEETLIKDRSLSTLTAVINSEPYETEKFFHKYIKQVLAAKDWANKEIEKGEKFWKQIEALPKKEKKAFVQLLHKDLGLAKKIGDEADSS